MKFTSKKTVSEVVIDLEDGCVIKLTKLNLHNLSLEIIHQSDYTRGCYKVEIDMKNGIRYQFKTTDELLVESLSLLCAC